MIIFKFRQHLFHYGLAEKNRLRPYPELVAILTYCSHLAVIQINDLPVTTNQSLFLLLQIVRIYT